MKNVRRLLASLLVSLALVTGAASGANAIIIDRIAAVVNDEVITVSDVGRMLPLYVQVVGANPSQLQDAAGRSALASEVLDYLIEAQLLIDWAEEQEMTITDDEIDRFLQDQNQSLGRTQEQFEMVLAQQGLSMDDFREFIGMHLTRIRMQQLEVYSSVRITDEDIDREVAQRYPDGLVEITITTSHVLVAVPQNATSDVEAAARERIEGLRAEIIAGTRTFEEIATVTNPDATARNGGRLGAFRADELVPEYSRAALALEVGEISEPTRSPFGFHLIRLEDVERRATDDEARIRDAIGYELQMTIAEREERIFLERLREDAYVEVLVADFSQF